MYFKLNKIKSYYISAFCNDYEIDESENIIPYLYKNKGGVNNEIQLICTCIKKENKYTLLIINNTTNKYIYNLGGDELSNLKFINKKFNTKFTSIKIY
jgi:hypothetical protein